MIRAQSTTQSRKVAMKIYRNRSRIQRLPRPDVVWEWETGRRATDNSVLQFLQSAGLIEHVEGRWWHTTEELAAYLESVHGVTLAGSIGQDTLPVDVRPAIERVDDRTDPDGDALSVNDDSRQTALDGGDPDPVMGDDVVRQFDQLGGSEDEYRHPSEYPGQEQLRECFDRVAG